MCEVFLSYFVSINLDISKVMLTINQLRGLNMSWMMTLLSPMHPNTR